MSKVYRQILLIPHIAVHNANALSSPYTIGFPAMTAWLGAVHALQRKLNSNGFKDINFEAVAVVSHNCDLQTYKGPGDYVNSIIGTGNPLEKDGKRSAFIEEPRCHLDVSLIIEYSGATKDDDEELLKRVSHHLNAHIKIAGGDILGFDDVITAKIKEGVKDELQKLIRNCMPGYAIVERRELMIEAMESGKDAIDALLEYLAVHHSCAQDDTGKVTWSGKRKTGGWIVPIATGFHGITDLGQAKNQRDPDMPHRFAESVVTLGEFKMPHQINSLDEILWCYNADEKKNLYLCQQVSNNNL